MYPKKVHPFFDHYNSNLLKPSNQPQVSVFEHNRYFFSNNKRQWHKK